MKRLLFLSFCLILHACIIGQYVVINNTSLGGANLPFNTVYLSPESLYGCHDTEYLDIDLDKDSLIDTRFTSTCSIGGPYQSGSLTIETFNNFHVQVDTNFQTLISYVNDTFAIITELRKVPVPKKYLLNDTIYQNAYSWDSTETKIGAYSWTYYSQEITWIDIDYFEGDTTYIALTKSDGNYNSIYYFQVYVHNYYAMTLLSVKTNDSVLINSQDCLADGIVFTQQSQIDNFYYDFPFCNTIEGDVEITGDKITNLNGLIDLTTINGNLKILSTDSLVELSGLNNLTVVGGNLHIKDNSMLNNLAALSNLDSIGGDMLVENNNSLQTLLGLENIKSATINDLIICKNDSLVTCDFPNICQYLSNPNGEISIYENATGCNNAEELLIACDTTNILDNVFWNSITIHPNPTEEVLHISFNSKITVNELNIYNPSGQLVLHENQVSDLLNVTSLKPGIYIVELKLINQIVRRKLIIK